MKCTFKDEYLDELKHLGFNCEEEAVKDGLCIFHHPTYWKGHEKEVKERFYQKIESKLKDEGELLCIGYNLPEISLSEKSFRARVCFRKSNFHGKTSFFCVNFFGLADFSLATFSAEKVSFTGARFSGKTNFDQARFLGKADFSDVAFLGEVSFFEVIFSDWVDFFQTTFSSTAHFSLARFSGGSRFRRTIFSGDALFQHAAFSVKADFSETAFSGLASFFEAKFSGQANFSEIAASKGAMFMGAEFSGTVHFSWAKFSGEWVSFRGARFSGQADFSLAKFLGEADFFVATFSNEEISFRGAEFLNNGVFVHLCKSEIRNDPNLNFKDANFGKPRSVRFDDFDLGNTSFLYVDISEVDIGERVSWGSDRRILDERFADAGHADYDYEVVATVYRRLRQNLESKMRYTEAGRFFIGEMECKRKNVRIKNPILRWLRTNVFSALAWYKYMSHYGESYARVLTWIFLVPILASAATALAQTSIASLNSDFFNNFQRQLGNYVLAFFQLKTDNLQELAVRLLSLLLMGQLYISLRRQFERKYKGTS